MSVSVVMPTFNRARFISEALDSIGRQTTPPEEIVIVDDHSTDDTRDRVEAHALRPLIRYILQSENRGASIARNTGVENATGETIVFLDSDDLLDPAHHSVVVDTMGRCPEVALFCCDALMIGPTGELLDPRTFTEIQCAIKGWRIESGQRSLEDIFLFSTSFPGMAVSRQVYRELGGLDQTIFPLDDYDLQLKVAAAGHAVHYEHRPLARYRVHGNNESGAGRAVRVGQKKLLCMERAQALWPRIGRMGARAKRRQGEVRRELAIALLKDRRLMSGTVALMRSLVEEPYGVREVVRSMRRRLARRWRG